MYSTVVCARSAANRCRSYVDASSLRLHFEPSLLLYVVACRLLLGDYPLCLVLVLRSVGSCWLRLVLGMEMGIPAPSSGRGMGRTGGNLNSARATAGAVHLYPSLQESVAGTLLNG